MRTNDQLAAIFGETTFQFQTTVGIGRIPVTVFMSYEYDSEGFYNEEISDVKTDSDFSLIDAMEESTIDDLCILGSKLLTESKQGAF